MEHIEGLRLAAAFFAAAIAFLAILSHRRTTARKSTLEFIVSHELHDPKWLELRLKVFPILSDPAKWGPLVTAKSTPKKQDVLAWLNHHEVVALGIKHRTLDRNLYFDWLEDLYRADWELAKDFVGTLRSKGENAENAFTEFEALATSESKPINTLTKIQKVLDYVFYFLAVVATLLLAGLLIIS